MKLRTLRSAFVGSLPLPLVLAVATAAAFAAGCSGVSDTHDPSAPESQAPDTSDDGASTSDSRTRHDAGAGRRDAAVDASPDAVADAQGTPDSATPAVDAGATVPTGVWHPHPGTSWQWQLSGNLDTSLDVQMYDIDLFGTSASVIASLKARGIKVICYLDAGSWEPGRPDSALFPNVAIGKVMDGWPDEKWLDVRNATVRDLIAKRMDVAVQKGCDGVEPDNVDGYSNSSGFPLTAADQLSYNKFLAASAHTRNLSVALKNDLDQVSALVGDFDFALNEQCFQYSECDLLTPFITAGKAVFEVEYGKSTLSTSICPKALHLSFDTLIKNLDLDAPRTSCR